MAEKRARGRALLWWCCALLTAACGSKTTSEGPTDATCVGDACPDDARAIDWRGANPEYDAHLRVVDANGAGVEGATVEVAGQKATTDKGGRAIIKGVGAVSESVVKIDAAGTMPCVTRTDPAKSSQKTHEVTVVPTDVDKMIDASSDVVVAADNGKVELAGKSLTKSGDKNGARVSEAQATMTATQPDKLPKGAAVGSRAAVDRLGRPSAIEALYGVMHVAFRSVKGEPLNLAEGVAARIEFSLDDVDVKVGDRLSLFSLDETTGAWREETTCSVAVRSQNGRKRTVCQGAASHFSYWSVGRAVAIDAPGSLGCMNVAPKLPADACFKVEVESFSLGECAEGGAACTPASFADSAFAASGDHPEYCGILAPGAAQRVAMVLDVDASGCDASEGITSGRHVKVSDAFALDTFAETRGSELLVSFARDAAETCSSQCRQVELAVTADDLKGPAFRDGDGDGYFAREGATEFLPWERADCADDDAKTHPFAPELFCVSGDRDCDGRASGGGTRPADTEPESWNRYCNVCGDLDKGSEEPGNGYDEDCDGIVEDRDGDGVLFPADCNDEDPRAAPGKKEVPGNFLDEDCDGFAVDQDGDGFAAPLQVPLAASVGLSPDKFTDCDDFDGRVRPDWPPDLEAGALAPFYYEAAGVTRRYGSYCSLFDEQGVPVRPIVAMFADLNCDGTVTDLDGDGFAAISDPSATMLPKSDCNDFDPRVHPASKEDTTCADPGDLPADLACKSGAQSADGCPSVTLAGVVLSTRCAEALDAEGNPTGTGTCSFNGWKSGNPLSNVNGALWGPCDTNTPDEGALGACGTGAVCGGELPYSDALSGYLESTYNDGAELAFHGMCFPTCTPP